MVFRNVTTKSMSCLAKLVTEITRVALCWYMLALQMVSGIGNRRGLFAAKRADDPTRRNLLQIHLASFIKGHGDKLLML